SRGASLLCGGALHKSLAALHLVMQGRLVDLDHDRIGIDAEVLHQRLRDVAHHADLLFFGAATGHADGNLGHHFYSLLSCNDALCRVRHPHPQERPLGRVSKDAHIVLIVRACARGPPHHEVYPHLTSWRARTSRTLATNSPSLHENCAGRVSRHSWFEAMAAAALAPSIKSLICTSPRAFSSGPWMITQGELRRSAYLSCGPILPEPR